jgi:hypothetical protein
MRHRGVKARWEKGEEEKKWAKKYPVIVFLFFFAKAKMIRYIFPS